MKRIFILSLLFITEDGYCFSMGFNHIYQQCNQQDTNRHYLNPRFEIKPAMPPLAIPEIYFFSKIDSSQNINSNVKTSKLLSGKLFSLLMNNGGTAKNLSPINSSSSFEFYKDKIIASIRINQLDVFGPTLQDTSSEARNLTARLANSIHLKTTEKKLRKQLLFSVDQSLNPQLMADNEKIIRDLPYIQDVAFVVTPSLHVADEVDVLILIKEKFEYGFVADIELPETQFKAYDENMFGLGHQFYFNLVHHQVEQPNWGMEAGYLFSDLVWKFINGGVNLTHTFRKAGASLFVEKKFLSSGSANAGGLFFERITRDDYLTPYRIAKLDTSVSFLNSELWFGHSFIDQTSNSALGIPTLAGRIFHQHFYPPYNFTTRGLIRNHDFLVASLGFSKRNLFKNNMIYGYGITEDIPYGRYFEVASGVDFTPTDNRFYAHLLYSKAHILPGGGYIKGSIGVGGFLKNSSIEQGAFKLNLNFFSRLTMNTRNPYRLFANLEFLNGINRFEDEFLCINRRFGLRDFRSDLVKGESRLKINVESVHFLNWNYNGFKVAHYFYGDGAFIAPDLKTIFTSAFYTGIGLGIRVYNESLVFRVFELRLSWFPIVPIDQSALKLKIFTQSKSIYEDFLGRKPQEISFE